MATVKVLAGDVPAGKWTMFPIFGTATMRHPNGGEINLLDADEVEQLTEERVKKLAGTALWGVAGAALLGPLGAIGGMLIGGNRKEIAFTVSMRGGKRFMAVTDGKTWTKILAARFR